MMKKIQKGCFEYGTEGAGGFNIKSDSGGNPSSKRFTSPPEHKVKRK